MNKLRAAVIVHLLWSMSVLASLSTIYNTATPGGGDDPRLADDEMRLIKAAIQERMNDHNGTANEGDHYWPLVSSTLVSNVDTGQHRMVTLRQMTDNPSTLTSYSSITDLGFLYQKDVSGNGELFWQDEAANYLQLTTGGLFNLNSAIWDGVFATNTSDAGDSKSVSLTSGGAYGVGRGAGIILYGNEYGSGLSGQLVLEAGYSTETTKAVIDVKTSKISNMADPAAAQDAATKAYVDTSIQSGSAVGTGSTTTISTSFEDMSGMSVTLTTLGKDIIVQFSAPIQVYRNTTVTVGLVVDTDAAIPLAYVTNDMGDRESTDMFTFVYRVTGLSAAEHTFKVQWKTSAGTATQAGASGYRSMVVWGG